MSASARALLLLVVMQALLGCRPRGSELLVFAAASLSDAFTEIAAAYEAENPGTTVTLNLGSSSQLAAQLVEGAPAAVFASANERQMDVVVENGRIKEDAVSLFATNKLAIAVPAGNPQGIITLADLARPNLLLVVAVPGVPVRQYTDEVVRQLGPQFSEAFYANVVSEEENVRQVLAKVALAEADAGLVYVSDISPDLADSVTRIDLPRELEVVARYPIAMLEDAPERFAAESFISFVQSADGRAILARWGFGPPP